MKPNLTKEEVEALRSLQNDPLIVIKPADKGSAVVIMDRDQYVWEGYRQLFDKNYIQLDKPIYIETIPMIKQIAQTLHDKKNLSMENKKPI